MNNQRRKEINKIISELQELQSEIERIRDDEQDYYDNMPENLQCGLKAETAELAIDNLDEANDNIVEVINSLEQARE